MLDEKEKLMHGKPKHVISKKYARIMATHLLKQQICNKIKKQSQHIDDYNCP
jgi:hypothetical protein